MPIMVAMAIRGVRAKIHVERHMRKFGSLLKLACGIAPPVRSRRVDKRLVGVSSFWRWQNPLKRRAVI